MKLHGQLQTPAVLQPRENPPALWKCLEGWLGPRASLKFWRREKFLAPAGIRAPYVPAPVHNAGYVGYGISRVPYTRLHNPKQQPEDMVAVLAFIGCVEYNFTAVLILWILLARKWEKCLESDLVESSWNVMAHGDAREKWRGKRRMEWVTNKRHVTAEHRLTRVVQTLQADVNNSPASSRLNWRPRPFKWTRPRFAERGTLGFLRVCHHISTGLYQLS